MFVVFVVGFFFLGVCGDEVCFCGDGCAWSLWC